ncbi:MAG TPA: MlaD family protein, partial [Terriglobales bacterium]|nr:MlaD family protein [Terriglobales bacterium]
MASESSKFQVGVFVIIAVVIGVGTIIWLGATRLFEETETFVTYFSESVQGLDSGSPVKFRGVQSGRVGSIRIAPDGNLIEVELDIDDDAARVVRNDDRFRAKLELTGITGLRYI